MIKTKEFLKMFDSMYMQKELSAFSIFNRYLKQYLKKNDYDTFITFYAIGINIKIKRRMDAYDDENHISGLPEHLKHDQGLELFHYIQEWQQQEKEQLNAFRQELDEKIMQYFSDYHLDVPEGFVECINIIGRTLINGSMLDNEALERSWYIFSYMIAIGYKGYAAKEIKKEYQKKYFQANEFIKKKKIMLPYYYVLVWDLWKSGKDQGETYKHNQERIRKNLAILPDVYRDLISTDRYRPEVNRFREPVTPEEEHGLIRAVHILDDIHVYEILPSFSSVRPHYDECRNSIQHEPEKMYRSEYYHPYPMLIIPCTELYRSDHMDVETYINMIYWEQRTKEIEEDLDKYELSISEEEAEADIEAKLQVSKELNNKNNVIPNKEILLHKLEKNSTKVGTIIQRNAPDTDFLKRFKDYGFAKKTYYDLLKNRVNSEYKSVPSKDTVIALICAMELNVDVARKILLSCGYIFSQSSERDVIIEHMIENEHWDLFEINRLLETLGLKQVKGKSNPNKDDKKEKSK